MLHEQPTSQPSGQTSGQPSGQPMSFLRDTKGAAAVEFVLWCALIVVPMLSAVDIGIYAYEKMQVEAAAQAAVQAAFHSCDASQLPAASKCANVLTTMRTAAQSTSLGSAVTLATAMPPTEGYYCIDSNSQMVLVGSSTQIVGGTGTAPTAPSPFNCSSVRSGSTDQPGDYLAVTVTYNYTTLFSGISVANLLATEIRRTAWMRLA